jgi:hypothetical protein
MLISHRKHFVFIHVYKTGGTAISQALVRYARWREQFGNRFFVTRAFTNQINAWFGLNDQGNRWLTGAHKHATASELRAVLGPKLYDSYFTFAFVRNPWDWQCSLYHYIRGTGTHRDYVRTQRMSLTEFLKYQVTFNAPCQVDFLTDAQGTTIVNKVGRFETLQKDFEEVLQILRLPKTRLNLVNESARAGDYRQYYDSSSVELVRQHFARDIERFHYEY